jgi:hypothetical protein
MAFLAASAFCGEHWLTGQCSSVSFFSNILEAAMTVIEIGEILKKAGFSVPDIFTKESNGHLAELGEKIKMKFGDPLNKITDPCDMSEFRDFQKSVQESIKSKWGF